MVVKSQSSLDGNLPDIDPSAEVPEKRSLGCLLSGTLLPLLSQLSQAASILPEDHSNDPYWGSKQQNLRQGQSIKHGPRQTLRANAHIDRGPDNCKKQEGLDDEVANGKLWQYALFAACSFDMREPGLLHVVRDTRSNRLRVDCVASTVLGLILVWLSDHEAMTRWQIRCLRHL